MTEDNCGHARVLADYEEMRLSFHIILDLLMPEEGDALLLLGDHGGRDPVALREALVSWMKQTTDEEGQFEPRQRAQLPAAPGAPVVDIDHMLDEYWWVQIYPGEEDASGFLRPVLAGDPGYAVLRVDESGDNLPIGDYRTPRDY